MKLTLLLYNINPKSPPAKLKVRLQAYVKPFLTIITTIRALL